MASSVEGSRLFSQAWRAIASESGVASAQLALGATNISKCSPDYPSSYAQAFFPLSIGLERMCKLALHVDSKLRSGAFLSVSQMRKHGHKLGGLLDSVEAVSTSYTSTNPRPASPIHQNITAVLSEFAIGGRYHNLDQLGGATGSVDPVTTWWSKVVMPVAALHYPQARRERDVRAAGFLDEQLSDLILIRRMHVDGSEIRSVAKMEVSRLELEAATPWVRMYVLQVARWVAELLALLGTASQGKDEDIPTLWEFFAWVTQPDDVLRKRKRWP